MPFQVYPASSYRASIKTLRILGFVCSLLLLFGTASAHSHGESHDVALTAATPSDTVSSAPTTDSVKTLAVHSGVDTGSRSSGNNPTLIGAILAKAADFHSPIVHFPIAWVLLLVLLEGWSKFRGRPVPEIGLPLAILAALSFLPTAATGLLHAQEMAPAAPALQDVIQFHRNLALAGGGLMGLAVGLRLLLLGHPSAGLRVAYWFVLAAVLVLSLNAGNQGGIIAHSAIEWNQ